MELLALIAFAAIAFSVASGIAIHGVLTHLGARAAVRIFDFTASVVAVIVFLAIALPIRG